jgi:hypothetical protein
MNSSSQQDDQTAQPELIDSMSIDTDHGDDEDDPFTMAMKELSETNRMADEHARV